MSEWWELLVALAAIFVGLYLTDRYIFPDYKDYDDDWTGEK